MASIPDPPARDTGPVDGVASPLAHPLVARSSAALVPVARPHEDALTVQEAASRALALAFGAVAVSVEALLRAMGSHVPGASPGAAGTPAQEAVDTVLGLAWTAGRAAGRLVGGAATVVSPAVRLAADPPLVPRALRAGTWLRLSTERWQADRPAAIASVARTVDVVTPSVSDEVLGRIDLTGVVLQRVDLGRVVDAALNALDLTELVVDRVDLGRVVGAALDQLDLTELVVDRVDLSLVVDTVLDRMDLTELVLDRVDLVGVAQYVVDGIDLPAIIQESTGSVASEAVVNVRMKSADADEMVSHIVDRLMLRRRARKTEAPAERHADQDHPRDDA